MPTQIVSHLLRCFDQAIEHKRNQGNFSREDVDTIFKAAQQALPDYEPLSGEDLGQAKKRLMQMVGDKINKGELTRLLQGTDRAKKLKDILQRML